MCLGAGAYFGAPHQKHGSAQKEEAASPPNHGFEIARSLTEGSKGHGKGQVCKGQRVKNQHGVASDFL